MKLLNTEYDLLPMINGPADIKKLDPDQLDRLCDEVRRRIIETVALRGGHLASSLGVVELTISLLYTYNLPADKVIYDVGHQCYAHKILTGRNNDFDTLRAKGGSGTILHLFSTISIKTVVARTISASRRKYCNLPFKTNSGSRN